MPVSDKLRTDTERLSWLENEFGCGLISDDNGHWACSYDGIQSVCGDDISVDVETSFFVPKDMWFDTIREALDAAMDIAAKGL